MVSRLAPVIEGDVVVGRREMRIFVYCVLQPLHSFVVAIYSLEGARPIEIYIRIVGGVLEGEFSGALVLLDGQVIIVLAYKGIAQLHLCLEVDSFAFDQLADVRYRRVFLVALQVVQARQPFSIVARVTIQFDRFFVALDSLVITFLLKAGVRRAFISGGKLRIGIDRFLIKRNRAFVLLLICENKAPIRIGDRQLRICINCLAVLLDGLVI